MTEFTSPELNPTVSPVVQLETLVGSIPRVTATPTWTPKLFKEGFALSLIAGTYKFWVYDSVGNVWKSTTLS